VVKGDAALNGSNGYGKTPLMSAAYESNLEGLRYLTELGPGTDIPNYLEDSDHHLAALSDCMVIIKILLHKGISVDLTDTSDCTPLHISVKFVTLEATKTLVERDVAVNDIHKHAEVSLT